MRRSIFVVSIALLANGASAAPITEIELSSKIIALDTELFDAYNRCDVPVLSRMVTEDLEFYHDQSGLSVGRQIFIESIRKYICGKTRRSVLQGTLEVYPLKGYGAVETGTHTFCSTGTNGQCTTPGAPAKFLLVWKETDGAWQLSRVVSYDHH